LSPAFLVQTLPWQVKRDGERKKMPDA